MSFESDLELAARLVRTAGGVALELRGRAEAEVKHEGPTDIVTEADRRAEALLLDLLREERPGDGVLGEEGASVAATGARRWVLDPVDGTHNYARGIPVWCAAVALLDEDGPAACAVLDPERGELFTAARGGGAALDGAPLRAGGEVALGSASVAMFVDVRRRDPEVIAVNASVAERVGSLRCLGCGSIELAYVAAGRIDAWLQPDSEPWDWHPGALLVREAGGAAYARGRWYVASRSPALAEELLALAGTE
jgi:fructose-1,6-bisphosphatase/inositol monophosphatase family enzyme